MSQLGEENVTTSITYNKKKFLAIDQLSQQVKQPAANLKGLCISESWSSELSIFKSIAMNVMVRIRSGRLPVLLRQLLRKLKSFKKIDLHQYVFKPVHLLTNETIDTRTGDILIPSKESIRNCLKNLSKSFHILDLVIDFSSHVFTHCLMWLRLKHLIQHMLPLIAAVSRIRWGVNLKWISWLIIVLNSYFCKQNHRTLHTDTCVGCLWLDPWTWDQIKSPTIRPVRMAEWSKAPDLSSGTLTSAWVRTPLLTWISFFNPNVTIH